MRADYERHLDMVLRWLPAQAHMRVLYVDYGDAVQHPEPHAAAITHFLERALDVARMAQAVDRTLHHQHATVAADSPAAHC